MSEWMPIETAPEGVPILLRTDEGLVGIGVVEEHPNEENRSRRGGSAAFVGQTFARGPFRAFMRSNPLGDVTAWHPLPA